MRKGRYREGFAELRRGNKLLGIVVGISFGYLLEERDTCEKKMIATLQSSGI